jgi:hypothetical protein
MIPNTAVLEFRINSHKLRKLADKNLPPGCKELGQMLTRSRDAGANLVEMIVASTEDWDQYEASNWCTFDRWSPHNPDDPEVDALVEFAKKSQSDDLNYERP